jgi:hypothetical protein
MLQLPIEISKICEDKTNYSQQRFHTVFKTLEMSWYSFIP